MTPEQLDYFRQRLIAQREELQSTGENAREAARPVKLDQTSVGRLSRMDAMQGQAMAIETQRRRKIQLQRIQAALGRVDAGDYGLCASCEEEIAIQRLETDAATPLCIACASRNEQPG